MITPDEALDLVIQTAAPLLARAVALENAFDQVLAEDILADRDYPPFDRSMMDGFAVRVADAGRTVALAGEIPAGSVWEGEVVAGQCVEILTGAPCPAGAEAVVPKENVERNENAIVLPGTIKPRQNIAAQGSDCSAGQCIVPIGERVGSMAIGVLATFGRERVLVAPRPSLGIITTGAELARPGEPLQPGHIRNSNGPMLAAMARSLGVFSVRQSHVADELDDTVSALEAMADLDIVVLTGGVSVGTYDFVPAALTQFGVETIFHGVKQKPGKPILFARRGKQLIFGLPGNPLSCHFGFHRYVSAAVRKMSARPAARILHGALSETFEFKGGRTRYLPAFAETGRVTILPDRSSADIFHSCRANCYAEIVDGRQYQAGDTVPFTWLSERQ